jgi:two-component system, OmpR family, sensor histidine kinase KdpD
MHTFSPRPHTWREWGCTLLACAATTALTLPLRVAGLDAVNTVMLYLLMVVLIAVWLGRGPAVLSAFLAVGSFDFFHVEPHLSFAVSDVQYLLTFAVMLCVALLIGHLTTGLKERAAEAREMADRSQALADLARTLAGAPDAEHVQRAIDAFAQAQFGARAVLLCPASMRGQGEGHGLGQGDSLSEAAPAPWPIGNTVHMAATAVFRGEGHGHAQGQQGQGQAHLVRLLEDRGPVVLRQCHGATRARGVILLIHEGGDDWQPALPALDALASLTATALERQHYVDVAHRAHVEMVSERLRSSILSALSHDIRTPLTALCGQADAVMSSQPPVPPQAADMVASIRDQAWRLHHMVSKLLDMARLHSDAQSGSLSLRREWQPLEEVIGASIQILAPALKGQRVQVDLPADLPLLWIDAVLIERVFGNLLENAAKYGQPGVPIEISARTVGSLCEVSVRNAGSGFPAGRLDEVFGLFERGEREGPVPGMGLGLAICRAIVQAHGGIIKAVNPAEGGAEVRFTLPLGQPPCIELEAQDDHEGQVDQQDTPA